MLLDANTIQGATVVFVSIALFPSVNLAFRRQLQHSIPVNLALTAVPQWTKVTHDVMYGDGSSHGVSKPGIAGLNL